MRLIRAPPAFSAKRHAPSMCTYNSAAKSDFLFLNLSRRLCSKGFLLWFYREILGQERCPCQFHTGLSVSQRLIQSLENNSELDNFLTTLPIKEREDDDWARAEELVKTREREEVEIISASTRGFVVSFGSLIGFLPYRNLAARWKFLAFESWLRRRGLDPSAYRKNLGIIGKYEASSMMDTSESVADSEIGSKTSEAMTSDMKLEDLLMIYDQEKLKFLLSFVGQKVRVGVVLADRNSRKLIFSIKPKEKEKLI